MYLRTLTIKNFRAIEHIDVEFAPGINVIVGPNAIGKTTVLEAIRLAKSILAQRVNSEAQQTLISLGAASPHNPTQLIAGNLVQSLGKDLEVKCGYQLTQGEVATLTNGVGAIATQIVRSRIASNTIADFAAFLSSEEGVAALAAAEAEIRSGLSRLEQAGLVCRLDLVMDFVAGRISSPDPIGATFIGFLDQSLPFDRTKFSYFPADRAIPRGEVAMQLGQQDASQQLESHNSQPGLKYSRLKNTIFATIISSEQGRQLIDDDFSVIFSGVLRGRKLDGVGISEHGLMSIRIRDIASGRVFDIDNLSSGEKGLVLTFLLISRTIANDAVVLLDEPELHLNPAVCKDLLSFMVDQYVKPKTVQMIICSHSPEILAGAFEREECSLFHLVSGSLLTPVRRSDREEIQEALRRVGTSESEGLLYKGTVFVEGDHDVEVLEAGFGFLLRQYRLKDLGGRNEVEKQIRALQSAERQGELASKLFFIFDKDTAPTDLKGTAKVGVLQWSKRCLENYLIDLGALTDVLKDPQVSKTPVRNQGEVSTKLKPLAMAHLSDQIIRDAYAAMQLQDLGLRPKDVRGKSFDEASTILSSRIAAVRTALGQQSDPDWKVEFMATCEREMEALSPLWDSNWRNLCDGKRLFRELHQAFEIRISALNLKKRIVGQMALGEKSENWRLIESQVKSLLEGAGQ